MGKSLSLVIEDVFFNFHGLYHLFNAS